MVEFTAVKFWRVVEPVSRIFAKVCNPLQVFTSERSVVEATTMLALPLKLTPLIVRAVWSVVAVKALPEIEPVIVCRALRLPETIRLVVEALMAAKVVVVAFEVVELLAVKFCSVVEPATNRSPLELMVVVAVPPAKNLVKTESSDDEAFENEERPVKVWVPVTVRVPVAVMLVAVMLASNQPLPFTPNLVNGDEVPMPTFPPMKVAA